VSDKVKIGTWQGALVGRNLEDNLDKIRSVLTSSEADGLDFLCFPELCLSSCSGLTATANFAVKNDPRIVEFIRSSQSCETVILVGLAEQMDGLAEVSALASKNPAIPSVSRL
jgi:predicted amidohydrolase